MDIISNLKREIMEPKVFALMVKSENAQALYLGVHFSLEEAYSSAVRTLPGWKPGDNTDIDLWNGMPARLAVAYLMDSSKIVNMMHAGEEKTTNKKDNTKSKDTTITSTSDFVKNIKDTKNDLIKKLIEDGDVDQVKSMKGLISSYSQKYILDEIEKKNKKKK
jgi:hypothetical protein